VRAEIAEVEPESSTTYEIGTKMRLLEGAATANIAVFYTEFKDLQLTVFEGSTSRISNAAGAISEGIEFDGQLVTPWGISASLSAAYLKARFTKYEIGPCPAGITPPCDLTGKPLSNAPKLKGNLSLNYFHDLGDLPFNAIAGIDYLYKDDILLNVDQDPIDRQSAYSTVNLRLRFADDDERWSVQALLSNATNVHALDGSGDIPTLTGAHFARAINPRDLDITVKYRF
jgi:outer membrane receptor protein involved in Fe transport